MYNLTSISDNSTGMLTFIQGINHVLLFDWGGALMLIGVSIILFFAFMLSTNDVNKALVGTAFIAFTLSLSMRALDLLPNLGIFICLIILAGVLAVTWRRD